MVGFSDPAVRSHPPERATRRAAGRRRHESPCGIAPRRDRHSGGLGRLPSADAADAVKSWGTRSLYGGWSPTMTASVSDATQNFATDYYTKGFLGDVRLELPPDTGEMWDYGNDAD